MRKLNRKGFTLVELLAVIIILAIVVGITIPAILTTTSKARERAFQTSVESFANWLDRQYEAYRLGYDEIAKVDQAFIDACTNESGIKDSCEVSDDLLIAGGLKPDNYRKPTGEEQKYGNKISLNNGKFCVRLYGNSNGDYSTTDYKISNNDCELPGKETGKDNIIPGKLSKIDLNDEDKKIIDDPKKTRQRLN